ncbi:MAG: dihydrolipoamide acetyltransferase family protein [Acidiferrobacterales bacterium]
MSIFKLPDLGEGLQEAEIREWHVAVGDDIKTDQPLVSVETDKAIVDIPSPQSGRVMKLNGDPGDILQVGDPLVEFEGKAGEPAQKKSDAGTVVGRVEVGQQVVAETPTGSGPAAVGIKAMPAVRALARRLNVDIASVAPSGPDGTVTAADVERAAKVLSELGPIEPLRGVRRAMARSMTQAHAEVAAVTVNDDADINAWNEGEDITLRLIRAIITGCKAEPVLNAWYDTHAVGRRVIKKIDLGIAVDTEDGLFVPVLHDVANRDREDLRLGLEALKRDVKARTVPPEELRGYTITLSNFGTIGGRYADPVVVPPTVAILGAGRIISEVVAVEGKPEVHRMLPLSLSFDHRAVTGGEATRFLVAAIKDLELPE